MNSDSPNVEAINRMAEQVADFLSDTSIPPEWIEQEPPPMPYLVQDFLPAGKVGVLGGAGGVGKSACLLSLAVSVASNHPFFGMEVATPGKVLYLSAEDDRAEVRRRLHRIIEANQIAKLMGREPLIDTTALMDNLHVKDLVGDPLLFTQSLTAGAAVISPNLDMLALAISSIEPVLVIVDTYSRFNGGKENANEDAATFIKAAERLSRETGATILVNAHVRKGSRGDIDDVAGGARLVDSARWGATLHRYIDEDTASKAGMPETERRRHVRLQVLKSNYTAAGTAVFLEFNGSALELGRNMLKELQDAARPKKATRDYDTLAAKLVQFLRDRNRNGDLITANKLRMFAGKESRFGVSDKVLMQVLDKAVEDGVIIRKPMKPKGQSLHVAEDEPDSVG